MSASMMADLRARKPLFMVQEESERSAPRGDAPEPAPVYQPLPTMPASQGERESVIEMKEKVVMVSRRSVAESVFWVAASAFILVYGNGKQDFLAAVQHHVNNPLAIKRPFHIGCLCLAIVACIFIYLAVVVRLILKDPRHFDHAAPGALSAATLFGLLAYGLFSFFLWPVWGALIIPMIWCFFMAFVVLASRMPSPKEFNSKYLHMRTD